MYETSEDLAELQRALDESYASAGEHYRSLIAPERRSSAADVATALKGAFMINLATVTVRCEPLVAPVDCLFYRGRLWFSLARGTVRAAHLQVRRQVSATYVEGDPGACFMVHGAGSGISLHIRRTHLPAHLEVRGPHGPACQAEPQAAAIEEAVNRSNQRFAPHRHRCEVDHERA